MQPSARMALVTGTSLLLGACFERDSSSDFLTSFGEPSAFNVAPVIAGLPPTHVLEGEFYEFAPVASDSDGDTLEFSISGKPAWARFNRVTGRLHGTPGAEDVGNFTNIKITVSDGHTSASLADFSISVNQLAPGAATLSWNPPTENMDGSALMNLAGYRIYYGRNPDYLDRTVVLDNPGLTRYVVENLTPARWHFAMTSVNSEGQESHRTDVITKDVG